MTTPDAWIRSPRGESVRYAGLLKGRVATTPGRLDFHCSVWRGKECVRATWMGTEVLAKEWVESILFPKDTAP